MEDEELGGRLGAARILSRGGDPFRMAVEPMLSRAGLVWSYEELDPDVFGEELERDVYQFVDRIAAVWLCVTRLAVPS